MYSHSQDFKHTLPLTGFDFSVLAFSCQLLISTGAPEVSNKCWTCSFFKTRELRLEYLKKGIMFVTFSMFYVSISSLRGFPTRI